jgi:transposase
LRLFKKPTLERRARVVNQLQKVLEWANIKLSSVVSDIMGVSARAMLAAIVDGEGNQGVLAELAQGKLRKKQVRLEQALEGYVRPHHRFMLARHLMHIDFLEEEIAAFDAQIVAAMAAQDAAPPPATPHQEGSAAQASPATEPVAPNPPLAATTGAVPWEEAVALIDTAPGFGRRLAEIVLAEVGTDMERFPSAGHLASWAKVSPGNHESGGKRYSGKTGKGSQWLRSALVQAAHAAVKIKESHLGAVYRRLVARRGKKKAIIAVAHRLLVAIYHMLKQREPYRELGAAPQSEPAKRKLVDRLQHRIERLGYTVTVAPAVAA